MESCFGLNFQKNKIEYNYWKLIWTKIKGKNRNKQNVIKMNDILEVLTQENNVL